MQHNHRVSLIVTVRNEHKTIQSLIKSILQQTRLPDEVIFIDGKSSDKTVQIITAFQKTFKKKNVAFVCMQKNGNRAKGRNVGIKKARSTIICITDAGCILDRHWTERITRPLINTEAEVVAGFYRPTGKTVFQKALATYTSVMDDQVNPKTYLPSSRSIAFKKNAWEKAGGYPEELDTCEDLVFARRLKSGIGDFVFAKNAIVCWEQEKSLLKAFLQLYGYAKGDGHALFIRPKTPLVFLRYAIGLFLLTVVLHTGSLQLAMVLSFFLGSYIIFALAKNYRYVRSTLAVIYLPLLQITADVAVIVGTTTGILKRYW